MGEIKKRILIISCIICLLPIGVGLFFYEDLPVNIATHFDINNNPDSYMQRDVFIFGAPIFMMLVQVLVCIVCDISGQKNDYNKKATVAVKLIIPIINIVMYTVILLYAKGSTVDIRKIAMLILGLMFVVLGYYTPRLGSDNIMNFPKIKDAKIREKVVKFYCNLFIIEGTLLIISVMFNVWMSITVLALVLIESIILYIYTLIMNRKLSKEE